MFGILRVGNQDSPQNLPKLFIIIHLIDFYSQGLKMFFVGPLRPEIDFGQKNWGRGPFGHRLFFDRAQCFG